MLLNKKSIAGIVATSFLIVVVVISTISFQNWYTSYQTKFLSDIEVDSKSLNDLQISDVVCPTLYLLNNVQEDFMINDVKINSISCNVSQSLNLKMNTVDLTDCFENLSLSSGYHDVIVLTNQFVVSKALYFDSVCFSGAGLGAPQISFTSNNYSIDYSGNIILNWTATNAESCTASGDWSGSVSLSDTQSFSGLQTDKTYTLECVNAEGVMVTEDVNIIVAPLTCNIEPSGFYGGAGALGDPYQICDCTQLQNIQNNLTSHFEIINDFSCSSFGLFEPIGIFQGTLDGKDFTISDISIDKDSDNVGIFSRTSSSSIISNLNIDNLDINPSYNRTNVGGLVGYSTGGLYNLSIENSNIRGLNNVGGFIGAVISGTASNINDVTINNLNINASNRIGAIIGTNEANTDIDINNVNANNMKIIGKIANIGLIGLSSSSKQIEISNININNFEIIAPNGQVGGIIGWSEHINMDNININNLDIFANSDQLGSLIGVANNNAFIDNVNITNFKGNGTSRVGGLVGEARLKINITNSKVSGELISRATDVVPGALIGGIIGDTASTTISNIINTFSFTNITGVQRRTGGIIGEALGVINIYNSHHIGYINSNYDLGGILGYASSSTEGNLINSSHRGNINASSSITYARIGGLIGNTGTSWNIANSYSNSNITTNTRQYIGGIIGGTGAGTITINNTYHIGKLSGERNIGGLVGVQGTGTVNVYNSYHDGDITYLETEFSSDGLTGGLFGTKNNGNIVNSYAKGNIDGKTDWIGGLIGLIGGNVNITNSYYIGNITSWRYIGGLVGWQNTGTIVNVENSFFKGNINYTSTASALIGGLFGIKRDGNITNSYSISNISGNGYNIGGLVGNTYGGNITNSYFAGSIKGSSSDTISGLVASGTPTLNYVFVDAEITSSSSAGTVAYGFNSVLNSYWNNMTTNPAQPFYTGSDVNMHAINNDSTYFYNSANAPFTSWDTVNVWEFSGTDYPTLRID